MHKGESLTETPKPGGSRVGRWLLAAAGVASVGLAAVGAVLPGLPTTIFLILASWCFARSCPWLEDRLVRVPLFRPFFGYLDGARMPLRAVIVTLVVMWTAVAVSMAVLLQGDRPRPLVAAAVLVAAAIGSVFVIRQRARSPVALASRRPRLTPTDAEATWGGAAGASDGPPAPFVATGNLEGGSPGRLDRRGSRG